MRISVLVSVCVLFTAALLLGVADPGTECSLRITLVDSETAEPIPGLVRFTDADGTIVAPKGLLPRGRGVGDQFSIHEWYVVTDPVTIELPRAALTVTAFSGLDTGYATRPLDLRDADSAEATLELRRFHDAHAAGLWNANTHVHLQKLTRIESDDYLVDVGTADGLDLVFVSYLERAEADVDYTTNGYSRADLHALNTDHVHFDHGEEHRHNFGGGGEGYGHVMLLAIPELVYPVSIGPGISKTGTDGLPLARGIDRAHEMGGTVIWCHNKWGLEDIPSWLAGRLEANNIFDGGTHGSFEHSFYGYLNAGIKVPFSTGTDWFIYDFSRVYVPSDSRPTPEQWLEQLAAGRSFITNGPLLELTVNGRGIGEDVAVDGPGLVRAHCRAVGRVDFKRLELVQSGKVVAWIGTVPADGHYTANLDVAIDIRKPCWLALRTPPPSIPDDPDYATPAPLNEYGRELFAHTSATFVDVAGQRIFQREAGERLLADMQAGREFISQRGLFSDETERQRVLEVYDAGIGDMRQRLEAGAGSER